MWHDSVRLGYSLPPMEKLIADILSPYWWTSVVVVGLALNVLATYIVRPIDRWRDRRRARNQQVAAARSEEILLRVRVLSKVPALVAIEQGKLNRESWSLAWNLAWGCLFLAGFAWIADQGSSRWLLVGLASAALFAFAEAWQAISNARRYVTILELVEAKLSASVEEGVHRV